MRYVTVFITDKPMLRNDRHTAYSTFEGNVNRAGDIVAMYGRIDAIRMEFTAAQLLGYDELELLLDDLLNLVDGRDYAVKILREKYGMELGKRKTEDDILDWLCDQITGDKQNEKIQEAKRD